MHHKLSSFSNIIQSFCDVLRPVFGAELMVVDNSLKAIAGTGKYSKNIGTQRPKDSFVDMTLKTGKGFYIPSPKNEDQCKKCELRDNCPYSIVYSKSLIENNEVIGLVGLLGYNEDQQKNITSNLSFVNEVTKTFIDTILNRFVQNSIYFVENNFINNTLDNINEGIIIINKDNNILSMNDFAAGKLNISYKESFGAKLYNITSSFDFYFSYNINTFQTKIGNSKYNTKILAFNYCNEPNNKMIIFSEINNKSYFTNNYINSNIDNIIGNSLCIIDLKRKIKKISQTDSTVLIHGETGTGKELVARAIHSNSSRSNNKFIAVNCGAIQDTLLENELIEQEKNAFTGASNHGKIGYFELADHGTLFLDEISNLSLFGQAKILRTIEDGLVYRVGGREPRKIDVRVIAATNKDLSFQVNNGNFLNDLYYRINVVPIECPPLRDRVEDIPVLINHYIHTMNNKINSDVFFLSNDALSFCLHYSWPGNIRELINMVEYICNTSDKQIINLYDLPNSIVNSINYVLNDTSNKNIDKIITAQTLNKFGRTTSGKQNAANYLNISLSTLYRKIKKYNL